MKKEIQLPKLPYGQGNYSWKDATHTRIKLRKRINGEYKSVTGTTVQECNKKMKELEIKLETQKKEMWKQNPNNAALTLVQSAKAWMENFKLPTLKGKAYDTLESTYINQIATASFANFQPTAITDMDDAMWEKFTNSIEEAMDELELNGPTWSKEELANFDLY